MKCYTIDLNLDKRGQRKQRIRAYLNLFLDGALDEVKDVGSAAANVALSAILYRHISLGDTPASNFRRMFAAVESADVVGSGLRNVLKNHKTAIAYVSKQDESENENGPENAE